VAKTVTARLVVWLSWGIPMPRALPPLLLVALAFGAGHALAGAPQALGAPGAGEFRATVLTVGDGDTLRVRREGQLLTLRLACIDAPEIAQTPWGRMARTYLQTRLKPGREVTVLPHTTDRYGRTVAEVISDININLVMVEDGQAFAYRRYLRGCEAKEYLEAEYRASRHRYGVWQRPGGITRPWDFRQSRRMAVSPDGNASEHNKSPRPKPGARTSHDRLFSTVKESDLSPPPSP
jgi:endonuclease YncB( thermonuclease family)